MKLFTPEIANFIKAHVKGTHNATLCEMVNKEFNTNFNKTQIANFKCRNNLSSGLDGYFKKGQTPHNKGLKWSDWMSKEAQAKSSKTHFKKGDHSFQKADHNHKDVGSERIGKNGYIFVKIAEPNKRKLKHRYIYEQNYGKVPKDYICIFLDGNIRNFNPNNLGIITKRENFIINKEKLRYNNADLTKCGVNIARLIIKIKERKNGN